MQLAGYILKTGLKLEPFGDDISESPIANVPLVDTQRQALRYAGTEVREIASPSGLRAGPAVIVPDRVFVTEKLLAGFLKAAGTGSAAMLGLKRCISVDYNLAIQDVIESDGCVWYSCFYVPDASEYAGEPDFAAVEKRLIGKARRVVVPMRELSVAIRLPSIARQINVVRFPITSSMAAHVVHWATLLRLNTLQWGVRWLEHIRHSPLGFAAKAAIAIGHARSASTYRIMSGLNVIGRGCEIHPTAWVEASFIGDGARIGAGTTVRNSFVGAGAVISDQAYLMSCSIGDGAFISEDTTLVWCVCYPGSSNSGVRTQMSIFGRKSHVGMWCSFLDAKFLGEVMVEHHGRLVSSGTSFLGSCIGHDCTMIGKVLIMPGRAVPNGTFMVMRPDECIVEIPADLPPGVPMIRDNGHLVPLKR